MKNKKYILQDNACEAWSMAIKYCNDILAGKITLLYRKYFVESLHNAVELFIKQLMLNQNDYRVATIRKYDKEGEPIKSFLAANNLNSYFLKLNVEILKKFYSIEFNQIIEKNREILSEYFLKNTDQNITKELKLLQHLRNDETHFYIDRSNFVSEEEFQKLHNFMSTFYDILQYYSLLPFWGKPIDEHKHLSFNRPRLSSCSYIDLLNRSSYIKKLVKLIDGQSYWGQPTDSAYSIVDCLINTVDELKEYNFDDLYVYIEMLSEFGMLTIDGNYNEYRDEYNHIYPEPNFFIKFNI
ncbi:MAG: hypothetical protein AB9836_10020 [Aminipila sp.]